MENRNDLMYQAESTPFSEQTLQPWDDLVDYVRVYSRERPEVVALTCFCIGFILGWKIKPW
ncbi:MAG TPA: hypothetical protein VMP01_08520 [Pirellulaceae bacterium]|nr:hypothetical protein [Pirellulaceae bacterium]